MVEVHGSNGIAVGEGKISYPQSSIPRPSRKHHSISDDGSIQELANNSSSNSATPNSSNTGYLDRNHLSINVDAAFHATRCKYGIIITSADSMFLEAVSGKTTMSTALKAELLAI